MKHMLTRRAFFAALGVTALAACSQKGDVESSVLLSLLDELAEADYIDTLGPLIIEQSQTQYEATNVVTGFAQSFKASTEERDINLLKRNIQQEITEDFAAGNSVNINGWYLSRKESILYALAFMHSKSKLG